MTKSRGLIAPRGSRRAWLEQNQGRFVCGCGCGQQIKLLRSHHSEGVPTYVHGHNPNPARKVPPLRTPCECGCGELANHGKRYRSGHSRRGKPQPPEARAKIRASKLGARNPMFGKLPPNFKGGRILHRAGYVQLVRRSHPFATRRDRYVMEHRIVFEEHLRENDPASPLLVEIDGALYLRPEVELHHRDGIKTNNTVSNLESMTKSEHARLHHKLRHQR